MSIVSWVLPSGPAHKAGLHASAVKVDPMLYQHIDPVLVGNDMRMLVSDMAGRASVEIKGKQLGYDLSSEKGTVGRHRSGRSTDPRAVAKVVVTSGYQRRRR